MEGKAVVDLSNVTQNDQLIVSKKDYQDAIINVSELKSDMVVKLEKVSEVELKEAFVTNLKAEDILKKVIENYDKNFNTEQHFYKVNFILDAIIDSVNRDMIDVDLQFRFKKNNLKIHSNNAVNRRIVGEGRQLTSLYHMNEYFNHISLLEFFKKMQERTSEKKYDEESVVLSKYADRYMYEIEFKKLEVNFICRFLIDKETFAIVESFTKRENEHFKETGNTINNNEVMYKYRPYQNKWILKESYRNWNRTYLDEEKNEHVNDVKISLEV